MKRIKLVLAVAAVMVAMLAAFSGPAMAADDLNCRDARGALIRCDGDLYRPVNNYYPYYDNFGNILSSYINYSLYNNLYNNLYGHGYNGYWY